MSRPPKRVRIGLTLAPDVADILNKHGRSDDKPGDDRPTRTQIIEEAVRAWAEEKELPTLSEMRGAFSDVKLPGGMNSAEYVDALYADPDAETEGK